MSRWEWVKTGLLSLAISAALMGTILAMSGVVWVYFTPQ